MKGWGDRADGIKKRAGALLESLARGILGEGSYEMPLGGGQLLIRECMVSAANVLACLPSLRRRSHGADIGGEEHTPLARILGWMVDLGWRPEKNQATSDLCKLACRQNISFVAGVYEVLQDPLSDDGASDLYFSMPVLRGPTGRAKRVSTARKLSVMQMAQENEDIRSCSQVLAVMQALKRKAPDMGFDTLSPGVPSRKSEVQVG